VSDALYHRDRKWLVPSAITAGPWSSGAQHGGPVAALLARTAESVPTDVPMQVVRLTVELLRPVPIQPLLAAATVVRNGRRVQIVDTRLSVDDKDVAWARALRIRSAPVDIPPPEPAPSLADPLPDALPHQRPAMNVPYAGAVDLRFISGGWAELGPVRMWSRLVIPVVAGEEPSAMQRTAAAADFGNGVSRVLEFSTHLFINADLTVALSRAPIGEWIGFDVVSRLSPDGYGQAESQIFDSFGPAGRAVQSLFVEER
jgi:hypothetical protein